MILKLRLGGEVEWQIWDNIERLRFGKTSLGDARKVEVDYNMISVDGIKNGTSDDKRATIISMVQRGRRITITSNSLFIYLLNDAGKTIERI